MTRAQKVAAAVCFLACGLMVGASFMPWLSSRGGTFSGWDLYQHQRESGGNLFIVWNFFTASDGSAVPFFTGLVTLISGLWLAGWTAVLLALRGLKEGAARRLGITAASVVAALGGLENLYFYHEGGAASDASLKYGLILLWGATVVGFTASLIAQRVAFVRRHASTASPSSP